MVTGPPAPLEPAARDELLRSIGDLSRRFESFRTRLPILPEETEKIDRMRRTIASKRVQLDRLENEAQELIAEVVRLEDELHGREKALALLLGTVVHRIEHSLRDAWSPVPLLGYRLWAMRGGRLHGARTLWTEPSFVATCASHDGEVPHADGRCGRLGCGIYATKALQPLINLHLEAGSHSYVAALVALSGRIVEHENGYRASHARVAAAYAVWPDRVLATADEARLRALFAACDRIPSDWCESWPTGPSPLPKLIEHLTTHAEKEMTWI